MNAKKYIILLLLAVLLFGSFAPLFDDPFHEKTEKVCFWEWAGKEIYEFIFGER